MFPASSHWPWRLPCGRAGTSSAGILLCKEDVVIVLGIILLVIGFVANIAVLWTVGIVLLAIGAILFLMGSAGHAVRGRRHYW